MVARHYLSIEEYLELRREKDASEIDFWAENGIDFMFWWAAEYDGKHGITHDDIIGWLDCDESKVSAVSLKLLSALHERDQASKTGATHLISKGYIEDSFVRALVAKQIEMMDWHGITDAPRDFQFLLHILLRPKPSRFEELQKVYELKQQARRWLQILAAAKRPPTVRALAKLMNVQPSTVSRWFPDGLEQLLKDKDGNLRNPAELDSLLTIYSGPANSEARETLLQFLDDVLDGRIDLKSGIDALQEKLRAQRNGSVAASPISQSNQGKSETSDEQG